MIFATLAITFGIALIWFGAEKLEKYSVLTAQQFGFSPFFIGSTVIAFGTSAPEMLTTLFVSLENKGPMVIGNVIGSNVANLSLVFGSMLLIVSSKQLKISQDAGIKKNLIILIFSSLLVWAVIAIDPFKITSSILLLCTLFLVILFWHKNGVSEGEELEGHTKSKNVALKLFISLASLVVF